MKEKFEKIEEFLTAIGLSVKDVVRFEFNKVFKNEETTDMKEKLKKFDEFIAIEGFDKEEVRNYILNVDAKNTFAEHKKNVEDMVSKRRAESQKLAKCFPTDDIRSKVLLFDYAFEGGKFASTSDAYPNCLGIVGWINPDPNAPEGDRIYVLLLKTRYFSYVEGYYLTEVNYLSDGRDTLQFIDYGKSFIFEWSFHLDYDKHILDQREKMIKKFMSRINSNAHCMFLFFGEAFMANLQCACYMYHGVALQHGTIRCFLNY